MAGKRRHRWAALPNGGACEICPVSYQWRSRGQWRSVVVWTLADGTTREGGVTPPCSGRPEEKKP